MKRLMIRRLLATMIVVLLTAGSAHASLLLSFVPADGVEDQLRDSSSAVLEDRDNTNASSAFASVTVGDVIFGWAQISGVGPKNTGYPPADGRRLFVVFSAKVVGITTTPTETIIDLGYNDVGSNKLVDLVPAAIGPKDGRHPGTKGASEIAVILSGPNQLSGSGLSAADFKNKTPGKGFFSPGFSYEATVGLVDPAQDFFQVKLSLGGAEELGGFTVMDASGSYGNDVDFVPVHDPFAPGSPLEDATGAVRRPEVGLSGGISESKGDYDFVDNARFSINAVPEPASVAVWSLLAIGCVAFGRRRLSRKAA